jgi:hypothetical protein
MLILGRIEKFKDQNELRLQLIRVGRFFDVTCERGHVTRMSGIDLCRRLDERGEKVMCPECFQRIILFADKMPKIVSIIDSLPMTDAEREKQHEEYLAWNEERKRKFTRRKERLVFGG